MLLSNSLAWKFEATCCERRLERELMRSKKLNWFNTAEIILAFVFCTCRTSADTVTLPPSADTFIGARYQGPNGTGLDTIIGTQGQQANLARNHGLLKFDVASRIPSNAIITTATLRLTVTKAPMSGPNSNFNLHRLLRSWSELQTTWTLRLPPSTAWSVPGAATPADYSAVVSGTHFIGGPSDYLFTSTSNLVADVTAWVKNSSTNQGWLVKTSDESVASSARHFGSREGPSSAAPQLTVDYTVPPKLRIDSAGIGSNGFCLNFTAQAGKGYTIERRDQVGMGTWEIARVLDPGPGGLVTMCEPLASGARFYRVGEH